MRVSADRGGFTLLGEEESLVKNKTQQLARFGDPNEEKLVQAVTVGSG